MATAEAVVRPRPRTASARIVGFLRKTPVHVALLVIAVIWLVPTVGLAVTSFRPRGEIQSSSWWSALTNWSFTLHNYDLVLNNAKMGSSFVNSLIITIPSTLIPLALAALAAYAFSWIAFPFRDTIFLMIVALMVVPIQMALVPLLILFRNLDSWTGLNMFADWYGGIWLAHTAFGLPLGIFLLRNFFITLPRDLIEAARVDGASNMRIFLKVVVPLSVPALAAYGIFQFLWVWNDLLMALIFVQNSDLWPMTIRVNQMQSTYGIEWHLLSAGAFLLMIVPLIVFFALQRYFVQGLLAGSVK
ncbi:MAG TPA: carbohydrate ABC transporter permease [Gaiellaceae bacterium]|nr:carbohydrate ABC transporter permease [Gaiellaceae bacterium]